ncbi:MAG: hypothetical protein GY903_12335 [Fuerstiella sp.]|nr:hypothetical protein [Fuerstiella sp.]MCP4855270.1 hypothetical protein [Fuerstiella sp.]
MLSRPIYQDHKKRHQSGRLLRSGVQNCIRSLFNDQALRVAVSSLLDSCRSLLTRRSKRNTMQRRGGHRYAAMEVLEARAMLAGAPTAHELKDFSSSTGGIQSGFTVAGSDIFFTVDGNRSQSGIQEELWVTNLPPTITLRGAVGTETDADDQQVAWSVSDLGPLTVTAKLQKYDGAVFHDVPGFSSTAAAGGFDFNSEGSGLYRLNVTASDAYGATITKTQDVTVNDDDDEPPTHPALRRWTSLSPRTRAAVPYRFIVRPTSQMPPTRFTLTVLDWERFNCRSLRPMATTTGPATVPQIR